MELGITVDGDRYFVDKPARDYITSDYFFLLDPRQGPTLVNQFHTDPKFDIRTEVEDGERVNYVGITKQNVEFGRSTPV